MSEMSYTHARQNSNLFLNIFSLPRAVISWVRNRLISNSKDAGKRLLTAQFTGLKVATLDE